MRRNNNLDFLYLVNIYIKKDITKFGNPFSIYSMVITFYYIPVNQQYFDAPFYIIKVLQKLITKNRISKFAINDSKSNH